MKNLKGQEAAYFKEYSNPIMHKLKCKIKWNITNEIASNEDNHLITSDDCCILGNIVSLEDVDANYRSNDVLNNRMYPAMRLATLENNFWQLDGRMRLPYIQNGSVVNKDEEIGWVSNSLCDESGVFADTPTLLLDFSDSAQDINLTGLTITFFPFKDEYPTKFDVIIHYKEKNGTGEFVDATADLLNMSAESSKMDLPFQIAGYSNGITKIQKVQLVIKEWSVGNRRARIDEIEFGMGRTYENSDLIEVEETRTMNTVSSELPISTFTFTVLDEDQLFDAEKANNLAQFLTSRQPVQIEWYQETDGEDIRIDGGTYYLKEWNDTDSRREYKLVAEDLIGFTEEPYYKGTLMPNKKVSDLISELFGELFPISTGLNDKLDISGVDEGLTLNAPLPLKLNNNQCTYKDCFMMLAQIAGCVITTDKDGKIVFKKLSYTTSAETADIPLDAVFDNPPRSNLKSAIKQVNVNSYNYKIDPSDNPVNGDELYQGNVTFEKGKKYTFELTDSGNVTGIFINNYSEPLDNNMKYKISCYTYMVEITCLAEVNDIYGVEVPITINGDKMQVSNLTYTSQEIDSSGEIVTIDSPICSGVSAAQALSQNFIAEAGERDEFELEVKRNMLWECGDVLLLEKKVFGSETVTLIPCRVLENKKSLTKVRQNLKLRKLALS